MAKKKTTTKAKRGKKAAPPSHPYPHHHAEPEHAVPALSGSEVLWPAVPEDFPSTDFVIHRAPIIAWRIVGTHPYPVMVEQPELDEPSFVAIRHGNGTVVDLITRAMFANEDAWVANTRQKLTDKVEGVDQ